MLYQLLTGDLPFTGSPTTVMQKILNQDPLAPSLLNKSLSPSWDTLVRRALAKSPAARFPSADAFAGSYCEHGWDCRRSIWDEWHARR